MEPGTRLQKTVTFKPTVSVKLFTADPAGCAICGDAPHWGCRECRSIREPYELCEPCMDRMSKRKRTWAHSHEPVDFGKLALGPIGTLMKRVRGIAIH